MTKQEQDCIIRKFIIEWNTLGFTLKGDVAKWLRRGSAKPLFGGPNPPVASNFFE